MNNLTISKWMMSLAAAAAVFGARGAWSRDILMVDAGQAPDPRQVAAVFSRDGAQPIKLRGVRVLNTSGSVAATQIAAAKVDCPPAATPRKSDYKVRGVRMPDQSTDKATPTSATAGADCLTPKTQNEPVAAPAAAPRNPESIALMVPFRFNSAHIADEAVSQLDAMAEGIKLAGPDVRIIIEGHTDAAGGDQYNMILSYLRASAVRDYLVREHGLDARNLRPVGMGKRAPLNAENPHAAENRRVEFRVEQG